MAWTAELLSKTKVNNNITFRKIKIALDLKAEDILELLASVDVTISNFFFLIVV